VDCVGERRCVKVDIGGGRTVTASEDHLFLVRTGSGVAWRKAVALRPGDDIVTLDEANYEGFDDDVSRANEDLLRVWRNEARRLRILRGDVQGTAHATGVV
jgi:intein/homing endonuclease